MTLGVSGVTNLSGAELLARRVPCFRGLGEATGVSWNFQGRATRKRVPRRWRDGRGKLDPATPFDFVSTADTIGGNSGSPVLNRAGEFVGINFDRNRHGLVRNFVYTDEQARHIAVHSRAVLEGLRKLYDADNVVGELLGK